MDEATKLVLETRQTLLERADASLREASSHIFDAGIGLAERGEFDQDCYRIRIAISNRRNQIRTEIQELKRRINPS